MAFPELSYTTDPLRGIEADALVLALPPLEEVADELGHWPGLSDALEAVGFTGAAGGAIRVAVADSTRLPLIVVGTGSRPGASALRDAVGAAIRTTAGFDTIAIEAVGADADGWRGAAEGAVLGGYRFDGYKTTAAPARARRVILRADHAPSESELERVRAVGAAAALVKDLVHTPAEWLGPQDVADAAVDVLRDLPVEVEVLDETQLADGGYGGILGVGQGSDRPPRLVRVDYHPADALRYVALVGKGITFDTGGLSLKPAAGMVGMKYDMCGAATVLAVVRAAAQLRLPVRVSAWLCLADNMPSGRAIRPGDVLRILGGTTVEVLNTDAEGRLVLADGLVAASRTRPDVLIDVATLTGAISVALGSRHTGVMGSEDAVAEYLEAAASVDEPAWPLPLPAHMEEELDSPIADLVNAKIGDPTGGSLFAGLFLQRFVGRTSDAEDAPRIPWVHLDIAGSGSTKSATGATDKGPTAATIRSLLAFVEGDAR